MSQREFYGYIGPVSVLIIGRVWAIDIGRSRVWGDGWRIRFGRVQP